MTVIDDDAFNFYGDELRTDLITKVVIPEGVTKIGWGSFRANQKLRRISFPSTLRLLDKDAFLGCGSQVDGSFYFFLPPNIESVDTSGAGTFHNCNAILVAEAGTSTGETLRKANISYHNGFLEDDFIYTWVKDEQDDSRLCVFDYIGTLPTSGALEIPQPHIHTSDPVEWIHTGALRDLPGLKSLVIPPSVTKILDKALYNCPHLSSVSFPDSLNWIGANAFSSTGNNGQFFLSDHITYVDRTAFNNCTAELFCHEDSMTDKALTIQEIPHTMLID